jgi:hypothetical protein
MAGEDYRGQRRQLKAPSRGSRDNGVNNNLLPWRTWSMNGFLVVVRCTCDDVPLFLASTYAEAQRVAEQVAENPQGYLKALEIERPAVTPDFVEILEFANGQPVTQVATVELV